MRRTITLAAAAALCIAGLALAEDKPAAAPDWALNATIIEACSCPMFCQCYFNPQPASHGPGCCADKEGRYCRFNNAFRVNSGHFGATKLDGAKFWVAGDLGGDFTKGQMEWAIVVFDKATSKEQRDGIATILGSLYPVKWDSLTTGEGTIDWSYDKDQAHALLDGGKTAEVKLKRFQGNTDDPIVIKNLKYWGAPRNDGFVLMPAEVEAYRAGKVTYEFKGTNGFMITFDITSKDAAAAQGGAPKKSGY